MSSNNFVGVSRGTGGPLPYAIVTGYARSVDICELCHQLVKNVKLLRDGYYGIIDGCFHMFCLNCIRTYFRNYQMLVWPAKRNCLLYEPCPAPCPVCQTVFHYIVASKKFIKQPGKKAQFVREFVENMKFLPCNFAKKGLGGYVCDLSCSKYLSTELIS